MKSKLFFSFVPFILYLFALSYLLIFTPPVLAGSTDSTGSLTATDMGGETSGITGGGAGAGDSGSGGAGGSGSGGAGVGPMGTYTPLEKIPGASDAATFPQYVQGIYKFGIWTVGLAALFMLSFGGFIYLSSGGNTATISKAKTYIWDSLIGLVLALLAYLILNVINPNLVRVNLERFSEAGSTVPVGTPTSTATLPEYTPSEEATGTWGDDEDKRASLNSAGISINHENCKTVGQGGCTSVYKLPDKTIEALKAFKNSFCSDYPCDLIISGGTEYWLHKTHGPDRTIVDIRSTPKFRAVLEGKDIETKKMIENGTHQSIKIACKKSGRRVYKVDLPGLSSMYIWDEDNKHFHADTEKSLCTK